MGFLYTSENHAILIEKLDFYGIRVTAKDWFTSYLTNRQQFVVVNGKETDLSCTSCGIPQGLVLGPIFFYYTSMTFTILLMMLISLVDTKT